jgi:hypothetical protein
MPLKEMRNAHETNPDRRMPPILVVVTHIDELTPALEWAPPYDLVQADRPKAGRIRDAIEHVGDVLGIDHDRIVPVCVRNVDAAYNLDLLWNLVATNLDEARFAKLDRLRQNAQGFSRDRLSLDWLPERGASARCWACSFNLRVSTPLCSNHLQHYRRSVWLLRCRSSRPVARSSSDVGSDSDSG